MDNQGKSIGDEIGQGGAESMALDARASHEIQRIPEISEIAVYMRACAVEFASHLTENEVKPDHKVVDETGAEKFLWVIDLKPNITKVLVERQGIREVESEHYDPQPTNEFESPTGIGIDEHGELFSFAYPKEQIRTGEVETAYPYRRHIPTLGGRIKDDSLVPWDSIQEGRTVEEQRVSRQWRKAIVALGKAMISQRSSDPDSPHKGSCEWAQTYDWMTLI